MKRTIFPKPYRSNIDWKKLILADVSKERQQRIRQAFKKTKLPEFPKKNPNMEKHFYFPKSLIGLLSKEELSVYVVLCSIANFEKDTWFSIQKPDLARRSGLLIKTVNKALAELIHLGLVKQRKDSKGRIHYFSYRVEFFRKSMLADYKKQSFIFHTCIIDSGIWAKLSARAKVLYLSLRSSAEFDWYLYADVEHIDHQDMHNIYESEAYRNRKWDVCDLSLTELCKSVRIQRTTIQKVIAQLTDHKLIEVVDGRYLVHLKPRINEYMSTE